MRQLNWVDVVLSAFTAFCIASGGALAIVAGSNGPSALNEKAWLLSVFVGIVAAAKDLRSSRGFPPASDGTPPIIPQSKVVDTNQKNTDSQKS